MVAVALAAAGWVNPLVAAVLMPASSLLVVAGAMVLQARMNVRHQSNGETVITGPIPDQSALYGLLNRLRDLGIPLLAVNRLDLSQN